MKFIGTSLNKILSALRVRPTIDGLEISDTAVRFARLDGPRVLLAQAPLLPNTVVAGQIKDYPQFVASLKELWSQTKAIIRRRKIHVTVSLSSADVYTQVFALPAMEGANLEKAVELNLKMISPADISQMYVGWQVIAEGQKTSRLEVLGAFVNRTIVDEMRRGLADAGFAVHSVEPRALSFSRLLRELGAGFDPVASYMLITVDANGAEFLVIRKAQFYFHYFNSWRDIQGDEKQISKEIFDAAIVRDLRQVLNFYNAHWPERLAAIFVVPTDAKDEVARIVGENVPIEIFEFGLRLDSPPGAEWFAAIGGSLRNAVPHAEDKEMSLLGISAREEFRRHELLDFLGFWRILIPIALGVLLVLFFGAYVFLGNSAKALRAQSLENISPDQAKEANALKERAGEFNRSVALITAVMETSQPKVRLLEAVNDALAKNNITLTQFSFQEGGNAISLSGVAQSENQILNLKKTLEDNKKFGAINLPFTSIKSGIQGFAFSMTFLVNFPIAD